jgi:hypothetical protein
VSLLETKVADPALRAALLGKVPDKRLLLRLLEKADSAAELETLLNTGDAARAERLLGARAAVRTRLERLRTTDGQRIDADPALTKQQTEIEDLLKDATQSEHADKKLDELAAKLADQALTEGLNTPVLGVTVDENKFNYLFGNVAADAHNTPRALDNARQLGSIGFHDTPDARAALRAHLERVPDEPGNVIQTSGGRDLPRVPQHSVTEGAWGGPVEMRESLLQGPNGTIKLTSTWEIRYGVRRLTTVIPSGAPIVRPLNYIAPPVPGYGPPAP